MKHRKINQQIMYPKLLLIDTDGTHIEVDNKEAQFRAKNQELDLVELQPPEKNKLPVCKIMDYGKFKYTEQKKERKMHNHKQVVKNIQIKCTTDKNDILIKHKKIFNFLSKNYHVNYILEIKGRNINHSEIFIEQFNTYLESFKDVARWDKVSINNQSKYIKVTTTLKPI